MSLKNIPKASENKKYQMIEEGVDSNMVQEFEEVYHLKRREVAYILGVSEKTLYNILSKPTLDKERSDRFIYVNKIFYEGEEVFMNSENFKKWLNTPQVNLSQKKPLEMMDTINGAEAVYAEIIRTKHGVLS